LSSILARLLIILGVMALIGLSLSFRLGGMSPSDFIDASPNQLPKTWQVAHPESLIKQAQQALEQNDPAKAQTLTIKALGKNITSGLAIGQLAHIAIQQHQPEAVINKLAEYSIKLWPAYILTRAQVADYWVKQGKLDKALEAWHVIMVRAPVSQPTINPILEQLAVNSATIGLLQPYSATHPTWWNSFFSYMAANTESLVTLNTLYEMRASSETPIALVERNAYVNRLLKEELWQDAYFIWLSGLTEKQLTLSGLIYDGGFESNESNTGFDWMIDSSPTFKIEKTPVTGMKGQKALHLILYDRTRIHFSHITQRMLLSPGYYQSTLRVRVDRLQTIEGLRWRVRCINSTNTLLGESSPIKERSIWTELNFNFQVPAENCPVQIYRLEASSPYSQNHLFKGSLWFDDLQIRRQENKENTL